MEAIRTLASYPQSFTPSPSPVTPGNAILCQPDPACTYPEEVTGSFQIRMREGSVKNIRFDDSYEVNRWAFRLRVYGSGRHAYSNYSIVGGINGVNVLERHGMTLRFDHAHPRGQRVFSETTAFSVVGPNCQVYYLNVVFPLIPLSQIESISVYINWNGSGGPQCLREVRRP